MTEIKAPEPSRIKKLARNVLLATAAITSAANATSTPIEAHQPAPISQDIAGGEGNDTPVEMPFSDFSRLSTESQVTILNLLKEKHLNLTIDRDDLRLHVTSTDSFDHKLLQLNVSNPTDAPSSPEWKLKGNPPEIRMTNEEYYNLVNGWGKKDDKPNMTPDLLVPKGVNLKFFVIPLQRGSDPREVTNQLWFKGFTPPPAQ